MTKLTYTLCALLLVLAVACGALAYLWIDRSISLSYSKQSTEAAINSIRRMEQLLQNDWRGMSEDEVLRKLQKAATTSSNAKAVIKKEGQTVWFDEVRFNFDQGRLRSVGEP